MPLRLVHPVHRATHRIGLYLDDLRERGLTQGEAHILGLLAHSGPANVAELHRGLAHKRSTLTSILDRLAKRGLITRTVGETDRRTFVVRLTAKGRKLAKRVQRHLSALERAVARRVSAADIRAFKKVVAALEQEAHQRVGSTRTRADSQAQESGLVKLDGLKPSSFEVGRFQIFIVTGTARAKLRAPGFRSRPEGRAQCKEFDLAGEHAAPLARMGRA